MIGRVAVAFLCIVALARATPLGAPDTCCEEMVPGHPNTTAQTTPNPYSTTPDQREIPANGKVQLTLASTSADVPTFRGFLVVANEVGTDRIVGTFSLPSDGKVLDCVLADQSVLPMTGATHKLNNDKSSVTVDWSPSGFTGEVVFRTTFVLDAATYWVKQSSVTVTVTA